MHLFTVSLVRRTATPASWNRLLRKDLNKNGREFAVKRSWEELVMQDAKMNAKKIIPSRERDAFNSVAAIGAEFRGEIIDQARRSEETLAVMIANLIVLRREASREEGTSRGLEALTAFRTARNSALQIRLSLIVQREVSGIHPNATELAEMQFPIPPPM
jgi:hypothetical protein